MSDAPSTQLHSSPTALIVDDSPAARDIFSIVLKRLGYLVIEADDGTKALGILNKDAVDLVILDLNMEVISGDTVLQIIRSKEALKHLPVVVTTAHPPLVTEDIGAAASRVFYKPVNVQEFMGCIRGLKKTLS